MKKKGLIKMALGATRPYGLRDVKVKPWNSDGTLGAAVDLPVATTFKFKEVKTTVEFEGDDRMAGLGSHMTHIEWELEAQGISLDALKVILGGTVTDTGVTPNQVKRYTKTVGTANPYFLVEGQAISESGGDFHGRAYKCKCKDSDIGNIEGKAGAKSSYKGIGVAVSAAEATAIGGSAAVDEPYDFKQNETVTAIS